MGNEFISVSKIEELGEIIAYVYFSCSYNKEKAIQFMRWKGFKTNLLYEFGEFMIFYQDEKFVPNLTVEDEFYKIVDESNVWENMPSGVYYDYKYRVIANEIICVSFIYHNTNAETTEETGKL